jgi:uncharacterized protein (TIGR00251 family)
VRHVPAARREGADVVLELRVQPRAARSAIEGLRAGRVRVRLVAPPVDGRANAALVELLAEAFGVPRSQVIIEHGLAGRDKRVRVRGAARLPPAVQPLLGTT